MEYILLAYKSDSADYCRGCLMDSWSSDFDYIKTADKAELFTFWNTILDTHLDSFEGGYDITLLLADGTGQEHFQKSQAVRREFEAQRKELLEKRRIEKEELERKAQEKFLQRQAEKEAQSIIDKENQERELYLQLKERYENTPKVDM